jgi:hypothetical protein
MRRCAREFGAVGFDMFQDIHIEDAVELLIEAQYRTVCLRQFRNWSVSAEAPT